MKLSEEMKNKTLLSFELFPPKTEKGLQNLPGTIDHLMKYNPSYISCTYGAGGGNVGANREVCQMIKNAGTTPVTHFTVIKNTKEGIKDQKNFKIIASQTGEFTQAKGQEVMESFLKQNKDIDVVVAQNDNMAFGAIDALKAAGKTPGKDVTIISFDAIKAALKKVQSGEINAEFECNPLHGPRVAELAKKIMKGEKVDKIQYVDEQVFTKDNTTKEVINKRAY